MNRRSFFARLTGAIVASALDLKLSTEPVLAAVKATPFNPASYMGEFKWVHLMTAEETVRFTKDRLIELVGKEMADQYMPSPNQ